MSKQNNTGVEHLETTVDADGMADINKKNMEPKVVQAKQNATLDNSHIMVRNEKQ